MITLIIVCGYNYLLFISKFHQVAAEVIDGYK